MSQSTRPISTCNTYPVIGGSLNRKLDPRYRVLFMDEELEPDVAMVLHELGRFDNKLYIADGAKRLRMAKCLVALEKCCLERFRIIERNQKLKFIKKFPPGLVRCAFSPAIRAAALAGPNHRHSDSVDPGRRRVSIRIVGQGRNC